MIVFEGSISGQCLQNCNKKLKNEIIISLTIVSIIIIFIWYLIFGFSILILFPAIVCLTMYTIGLAFYKKTNSKPFKIIVDPDERTIVYEAKSEKEHFFMFDDIKSVYDYGEYYHFWQGDMFLCQKSLLVQGTLEEFEKLFEGKIIRKY